MKTTLSLFVFGALSLLAAVRLTGASSCATLPSGADVRECSCGLTRHTGGRRPMQGGTTAEWERTAGKKEGSLAVSGTAGSLQGFKIDVPICKDKCVRKSSNPSTREYQPGLYCVGCKATLKPDDKVIWNSPKCLTTWTRKSSFQGGGAAGLAGVLDEPATGSTKNPRPVFTAQVKPPASQADSVEKSGGKDEKEGEEQVEFDESEARDINIDLESAVKTISDNVVKIMSREITVGGDDPQTSKFSKAIVTAALKAMDATIANAAAGADLAGRAAGVVGQGARYVAEGAAVAADVGGKIAETALPVAKKAAETVHAAVSQAAQAALPVAEKAAQAAHAAVSQAAQAALPVAEKAAQAALPVAEKAAHAAHAAVSQAAQAALPVAEKAAQVAHTAAKGAAQATQTAMSDAAQAALPAMAGAAHAVGKGALIVGLEGAHLIGEAAVQGAEMSFKLIVDSARVAAAVYSAAREAQKATQEESGKRELDALVSAAVMKAINGQDDVPDLSDDQEEAVNDYVVGKIQKWWGTQRPVDGVSSQATGETERVDGVSSQVTGEAERVDGASSQATGETERVDGVSSQATGETERAALIEPKLDEKLTENVLNDIIKEDPQGNTVSGLDPDKLKLAFIKKTIERAHSKAFEKACSWRPWGRVLPLGECTPLEPAVDSKKEFLQQEEYRNSGSSFSLVANIYFLDGEGQRKDTAIVIIERYQYDENGLVKSDPTRVLTLQLSVEGLERYNRKSYQYLLTLLSSIRVGKFRENLIEIAVATTARDDKGKTKYVKYTIRDPGYNQSTSQETLDISTEDFMMKFNEFKSTSLC